MSSSFRITVNCAPGTPLITEPTDKSNYTQNATSTSNQFIIPDFEGGQIGSNINYTLSGSNASSLRINKYENNWIVTPIDTTLDKIIYMFKVNATDGCSNYSSMSRSFVL